jgi:hypothetical protein
MYQLYVLSVAVAAHQAAAVEAAVALVSSVITSTQ